MEATFWQGSQGARISIANCQAQIPSDAGPMVCQMSDVGGAIALEGAAVRHQKSIAAVDGIASCDQNILESKWVLSQEKSGPKCLVWTRDGSDLMTWTHLAGVARVDEEATETRDLASQDSTPMEESSVVSL